MQLLISRFLFVCSLLPSAQFAYAKNTQNEIEVIEIEQQRTTTANYQLIQRNEFLASAQSLSDVLSTINGVQITQISGVGNPVNVSIRGSSSKQVQLYIDGQLINDNQFGGFDLNQIPVEQIQSIEVSKSQAIGTGMTPIGGVIRVNTYNPSASQTRLSLAAGSFGFKEVNLSHNIKLDTHALSLGGQFLKANNDYNYMVPQTFDNSAISAEQPLRNNDYDKTALYINDQISLNAHNIRLNAQYTKQNKAIANYQNNSPENFSNLETKNWRAGYIHVWKSDSQRLSEVEFESYIDSKKEHYIDAQSSVLQRDYFYDTNKYFVSLKPTFVFDNITLLPYSNLAKQQFTSEQFLNAQINICNGFSGCDVKAQQTDLHFGTRVEWQSEYLPLQSYLLANKQKSRSSNQKLNVSAEQIDQLKQDDSYSSYELGATTHLYAVELELAFSKGIRTPTLFELYGDRGAFKGNANLAPEHSNTFMLASSYNKSALNITSSLYRTKQENAIVAIFNSTGTGSYTNVSDATLNGFELQIDYRFSSAWSAQLQANVIDSQTHSEFVAFDDKKLPGIYHQQYSVSLDYQLNEAWRLSFDTHIDKELYFNRTNRFTNTQAKGNGTPSDREISDFSVTWQNSQQTLSLQVNNIFNNDYLDLANRPAQGRSFQVKYSIKGL